MTTQVQNEIQKITDLIVKKYQPEKIILFGSYAWGKPTKDSDIDLMVIKDTDNTRETAREIRIHLWGKTSAIPMDLVVYQPEKFRNRLKNDDFFIGKVVNQGDVLYVRK